MRDNPIKARLAAGGHAFGTMVFEFFTPSLAQICKTAGAEFVLYDMEHSAVSIESVREQISYCRGAGLVPMVRVPATQYDYISRALDAGAMGIMVPMVETAEQAAFIVQSTRYPRSAAAAPPSASPMTTSEAARSPTRSRRPTTAPWSSA